MSWHNNRWHSIMETTYWWIKKMSAACYALRHVKYSLSTETLKIIYFAHIHTIINCSVIFWGNSSYAKKVFILQKKIIKIITNTRPREREIFRNMQIMSLYSQYIYIHYYYLQLITNIYLLLITKFTNTILEIVTIVVLH